MTKNEEGNIERCLNGLQRFDEVFVVDSGSTDGTVEIAEALGAKVVPFRWNGQYPKKKQWCLENLPVRNDWVLYVDADELVTPALAGEIAATIPSTSMYGFFVGQNYVFLRKVLRHGRRISKLVLFKHRHAAFAELRDLHSEHAGEVELHYQPTVDGPVGKLSAKMIHDDHESLYQYFSRQNRYTDWEAVVRTNNSLLSTGEASVGLRSLAKRAFARVPIKGFVAFMYSYVWRAGFLDGRAGFHYALWLGFYYWQIGLKEREQASIYE